MLAETPLATRNRRNFEHGSATAEGFATSREYAALERRAKKIPAAIQIQRGIGQRSVGIGKGVQYRLSPNSCVFRELVRNPVVGPAAPSRAVKIAVCVSHQT